jgi:hypothetical protein
VTATEKKAKPENAESKTTAARKKAAAKPKKTASTGTKPIKTRKPVANPPPNSTLEDISDFVSLSLEECVQLLRRLLASISAFPNGTARPHAVLKTVILFVAEYGGTP